MIKDKLFPNQEPDEQILLLLRRHWWVAHSIIFRYVILLLVPIIIYWLATDFEPQIFDIITNHLLGYPLAVMALSIYYLVVWIFFWHDWINYYLDVWMVTDKRIVNIEQHQLFSRTISELKLFRVQDVSAKVHGVLPTILHYGEVTVQTAGNEQFFIFKQIPHPYETSQQISKLVAHDKKLHQDESPADNNSIITNPEANETESI